MEKISIRQTYTQVSLYASVSKNVGDKKSPASTDVVPDDGKGGTPKGAAPKGHECVRSKDGDTFTVSIEARTLQISQTITIESEAASAPTERGKEDPRVSGGFVTALLEAMDKADGKYRKPKYNFPQLSDPEDLARKVLEQIDKDHAEKGGTRLDFADAVKKRLADWKPSSGSISMEYQEFRSQVKLSVTSGLDAWAGMKQNASTAEQPRIEGPISPT